MTYRNGWRCVLILCACAAALTAVPIAAQTTSDDALVRAAYPDTLVQKFVGWAKPNQVLKRQYSYTRADLTGSGTEDFIVAAYSNGLDATVRVLRPNGATAAVIDEETDGFDGGGPNVEAVDFEGDHKFEVVVSFGTMGPASQWLMRWNGSRLVSFGPTVSGPGGTPTTAISDATFVDTDGDGSLDIVAAPLTGPADVNGDHPIISGFRVWTYGSGGFTPALPLAFVTRVVRGTGAPVAVERRFVTAGLHTKYLLRVVNGDESRANTVTAAEVLLNGVVLLSPADFKNNTNHVLTLPVTLGSANVLVVKLESAPNSELTLSLVEN